MLNVSSSYDYENAKTRKHPVYIVEFENSSSFSTVPIGNHRPLLKGITGTAQSITPEEGKSSIGGYTAKILDYNNEVTPLISALHRRRATFRAGYRDMAETDFQTHFTGWVTDIKLSDDLTEYNVTFTDPLKWLQRKVFRGTESSTLNVAGNPINIMLAIMTSTGSASNGTYDFLDNANALGISQSYMRISHIEEERDRWFNGLYFTWNIRKREVAKTWLEQEIWKPLNIYPVIRGDGTFDIVHYHPPMPAIIDRDPLVLDRSVIIGNPKWDQNLPGMINEIEFNFDVNSADEYGTTIWHIDADSINSRGPGKTVLQIDSQGLTTAAGGEDFVERRAAKVFLRYAEPPPKITLKVFFNRHLAEAGDIVPVTHDKIPDIRLGVRGITSHYMEVINRQVNHERGYCQFTLLDTSWRGENFGVVAPTAIVSSGTGLTFAVRSGDGSKFRVNDVVNLCRVNMTVIESAFTVGSISGDTVTLTASMMTAPSSGNVLSYVDYDQATLQQKKYAFFANSAQMMDGTNSAYLIY